MKHIIFTALLLLGTGIASSVSAQGTDPYDDIYYSGKDAKKAAEKYSEPERKASDADRYDDGNYSYNRSSVDGNTVRSEETEDYAEYNSDDYSYASSIRRFNYGFGGMGYWNSFYSPFWYDPFWGPYGGYGYNPGWNMSIGYGYGPYWSSYWGWNSWYGYPGFYSYWNSPYCGFGYGGFYGGYYGGYNTGFWNGYYTGVNNGFGGGTSSSYRYGPRYSSNAIRNNQITRPTYNLNRGGQISGGERPKSLRTTGNDNAPVRGSFNSGVQDNAQTGTAVRGDRPVRGSFQTDVRGNNNSSGNSVRSEGAAQNTRPSRMGGRSERASWNSGGGRSYGNDGGTRSSGRSYGNSSGRSSSGSSWGGSSGSSGRSFGGGSSGGGRSSGGGGRSFGGGRR